MRILFFIFSVFSLNFLEAQEINIIYQAAAQSEGFYEYDWIKELLSGISYNEHFDGQHKIVLNNSIIILSKVDNLDTLLKYLEKFQKKRYAFGVIHLSDESYEDPTAFYSKAKFVFRNYWHKKYAKQKNIHFFPLGYKRGFWNNYKSKALEKSYHRGYAWSFIGQANKSTRIEMINQMKKVPNYFFYETFAFFDPNAMPVNAYRDILLDSIFAPCPRGWWNLDSFRVCEALECGCIPIVEKSPLDYFAKCYGSYPFLAVNSWEEAPILINELLSKPEQLEQLSSECTKWWQDQKVKLKKKFFEVINKSFK